MTDVVIKEENVVVSVTEPSGHGSSLTEESVMVVIEEKFNSVVTVSEGVQGPPGPGGRDYSQMLVGVPDGVRTDFELDYAPQQDSEVLYMNGLALSPIDDYTITGTTVSFVEAPWTGDKLRASYTREA